MDNEERKKIFTGVLPEEEFVDRRIHKSEFLDPESDSDNDDLDFVDRYDAAGRMIQNATSFKSDLNKSSREKLTFSPTNGTKRTLGSQIFSPQGSVGSYKGSADKIRISGVY